MKNKKFFNFYIFTYLLFAIFAIDFIYGSYMLFKYGSAIDPVDKRIKIIYLVIDLIWLASVLMNSSIRGLSNALKRVYDALINLFSTNENLMHAVQSLQDKVEALENKQQDKQAEQSEKQES